MSDPNRANIEAARRMLKKYQQKKEGNQESCADNTTSSRSLSNAPSCPSTSFTPEPYFGDDNGFSHSSVGSVTTSSTSVASSDSHQINGSRVESAPKPIFPQEFPSASNFFDNLGPSNHIPPEEFTSNVPLRSSPLINHLSANRTDSSCSLSTKSDDEASRKLYQLESQLAMEMRRKEELEMQYAESKESLTNLGNEVKRLQAQVEEASRDRAPYEEKVRMLQRTIEILVSEKTELQQALGQVSDENKNNAGKCVEYTVKMKALKSEVVRLETEAKDNREARNQHNSILKKLEHSLNESNILTDQYKKDLDVSREEIQGLKKIIHDGDQKNCQLKTELAEVNRKLSMAEMKMAQLGGDINESYQQPELNASNECGKLKEEVARMRKEVADNTTQYKDYIETLNTQITQITSQFEQSERERLDLVAYKEGLLKQLSDLEKQISKERQTGPSLSQSNQQLNEQLATALKTIDELKARLEEKEQQNRQLEEQLSATTLKLHQIEVTMDQLEVPDAKLLQAAMESDRVAASRAIEQNTHLKTQLSELNDAMNMSIVKLNNEKLDLTDKLQHAEHLVKELKGKLEKYHWKEEVVLTDSVAQCPMIFTKEGGCQTEILDFAVDPEHVTTETLGMMESKLRATMEQVAVLSDEKQRLEHLVLQLQGETETICEYVTLYQNQRGILREKVIERETQLQLLAKERQILKEKLNQISHLLPQVTETAHDVPDGDKEKAAQASSQIKTLLTEIELSNIVQDKLDSSPKTFHPCLLCSGKLITV